MPKKKSPKRTSAPLKRPVFLTIWLVIMFVGVVSSLYIYLFNQEMLMRIYPNMGAGTLTMYQLLTFVELVGLILIWIWNKLGFYLVLGAAAVALILNLSYLGASSMILGVVGIAILYLAMRPVWNHFK